MFVVIFSPRFYRGFFIADYVVRLALPLLSRRTPTGTKTPAAGVFCLPRRNEVKTGHTCASRHPFRESSIKHRVSRIRPPHNYLHVFIRLPAPAILRQVWRISGGSPPSSVFLLPDFFSSFCPWAFFAK